MVTVSDDPHPTEQPSVTASKMLARVRIDFQQSEWRSIGGLRDPVSNDSDQTPNSWILRNHSDKCTLRGTVGNRLNAVVRNADVMGCSDCNAPGPYRLRAETQTCSETQVIGLAGF